MKLINKTILFVLFFNIFSFSNAEEKNQIFTDSLLKKIKKVESSPDLLGAPTNNNELINLTLKSKNIPNEKQLSFLKALDCKVISVIDEYIVVQMNIKDLRFY
jgi:hypothetical protein